MRGIEEATATDRGPEVAPATEGAPQRLVLRPAIPFNKLMTESSTTLINASQRPDKLLFLISFIYPFGR